MKIETAVIADGEKIEITEGNAIQNEDGQVIRIFHTSRGNGGSYCDLQVYPDGKVYSTISAHSDETAARLCSALSRRLGLNK